MNVREIVLEAAEALRIAGIEEYKLEAELLLAEALGVSRLEILTDSQREINDAEKKKFDGMIKRRKNHEPYAYIVGRKEFMGLDFCVGEGILVPRPDTEILVETVMEAAKKYGLKTIAEIGVGSGCISVSLAKHAGLKCYGTDISETAVETAEKNAENNGVSDNTAFFKGDIFDGIPPMKYDAVVSNPPYIRGKDMDTLMEDVIKYEPEGALYGGEDGLDFYRKITEGSLEFLRHGGYIFYEIGYDEVGEVSKILADNGFTDIKIEKDLSGLDRVVWGRKGDFDV